MEDTITAISTALGIGAISIIRVSGNDAIKIVNKIFDKDLTKAKSHTIHYGHIIDNKKIIDEVLISVMLAPKTFTTEDIVEINCHGGIITTKKILELLLINGARLAEPGEFTKRAFLNGRIDLTQAEGIMNLIEAKSNKARELSINQLSGNVSNIIKQMRNDLIKIISNIEVNIDYPEYEDIEVLSNEKIYKPLKELKTRLTSIIDEAADGKIINEGINMCIIGKPNVGKSSLLNTLIEENKAIVTPIEGTTRDIVEGSFILDGVKFNIVDTAGIRQTDDIVEKIGVNKSLSLIDSSDLILFIMNNNEEITEEEQKLLDRIKNKKHLIIINKIDLESKLEFDDQNAIKVSIKNNEGIDKIKERIISLFNLEKISTNDLNYLSDSRSIGLLNKSLEILNDTLKQIDEFVPLDIIEINIREIWNKLGEIIGETYTDELIDEIFSRFCLGK